MTTNPEDNRREGLEGAAADAGLGGEGQTLRVKADCRPYQYTAWCIINPVGDVWGPEWFAEPSAALAHLKAFWAPIGAHHMAGFTFALAEVLVTPHADTERLAATVPTPDQSPPQTPDRKGLT